MNRSVNGSLRAHPSRAARVPADQGSREQGAGSKGSREQVNPAKLIARPPAEGPTRELAARRTFAAVGGPDPAGGRAR